MQRHRAVFTLLFALLVSTARAEITFQPCNSAYAHRASLADKLLKMFDHAYTAYMRNAHPADELRPLSCSPHNSFGNLSLTLIDTLDTFVVLGQYHRFAHAVEYLSANLTFDINDTVSVFETTIRVLGGLLSAHGLLTEGSEDTGFDADKWCPRYTGRLLELAIDLADRLMPAFDTPTGIPFGAVHLQKGVMPDESRIASTAGAGSLLLEFGTLSRYSGNPRYYQKAFAAMYALHQRASEIGLVGNHINIDTGSWVAPEAGIGGLIDSFYEYMLKGYILFGDDRLLKMFRQSYTAITTYLYKRPWYLDAEMWTGHALSVRYSSLAAFWPAVQVLYGDVSDAVETTRAHYSVWRRYGCLPEGYNVLDEMPYPGQINYPLRPELVESVFYLHWATNDSSWIGVANSMMNSIENITRVDCGYAAVGNTGTHELEDTMPSFLLSETFKYLYLVFASEDGRGKPHWLRSGKYVFTTEAHPLRVVNEDIRDFFSDQHVEDIVDDFEKDIERMSSLLADGSIPKCKYRSKVESQLRCGYGMPGTDFPLLDQLSFSNGWTAQEMTAEISEGVTEILRRRARDEGKDDVEVGEVLFGNGWATKILKIDDNTVSFERLDDFEATMEWKYQEVVSQDLRESEEAQEARECRRISALETVLKGLVCPGHLGIRNASG